MTATYIVGCLHKGREVVRRAEAARCAATYGARVMNSRSGCSQGLPSLFAHISVTSLL